MPTPFKIIILSLLTAVSLSACTPTMPHTQHSMDNFIVPSAGAPVATGAADVGIDYF
jgi:hypothetical protein